MEVKDHDMVGRVWEGEENGERDGCRHSGLHKQVECDLINGQRLFVCAVGVAGCHLALQLSGLLLPVSQQMLNLLSEVGQLPMGARC